MCLSVPAKVLNANGDCAEVEIYSNRKVVLLPAGESVSEGDWLLIYGTVALRKIDQQEAMETLSLLNSVSAAIG